MNQPMPEENNSKERFREALVAMMKEKGMRASEIARKGGMTKDALSSYTTGRSIPNEKNLKKLAKVLGCEPSDLLSKTHGQRVAFAELREYSKPGYKLLVMRMPLPFADAVDILQRATKLADVTDEDET